MIQYPDRRHDDRDRMREVAEARQYLSRFHNNPGGQPIGLMAMQGPETVRFLECQIILATWVADAALDAMPYQQFTPLPVTWEHYL